MSTVHLRRMAFLLAALLVMPRFCMAFELKPFEDKLFRYPGILETRDDGDWIKVDYQKSRDLYGRDDDPERKVKWQYVSKGIVWHQSFDTLDLSGHRIDIFDVGKMIGQRFSIVFVHGRGGDRKLGASDDRFGGNFNRLKNLAYENAGLYVAPSVRSFDEKGATDVSLLVRELSRASGGRPVILACASMGSLVCHAVARDPAAVSVLSGMILMSAIKDADFETTPFYTAHIPLFIAHGTDDEVYAAADQQALYDKLHKQGYPVRFVLFNTGSHGTPLRMLDWRTTLNWFLARS